MRGFPFEGKASINFWYILSKNRKKTNTILFHLWNKPKRGNWHVFRCIKQNLTFFVSVCTPLFDTPAILERSGLYFLPVLLFWKCQKGPTPGEPWVNKSSAAPVTGEASMSISLVCPPSPRWGKTLIAAFDLLILLPSSLPFPFIITRFYLFVYKYPVNENFAFSPG